MRLATFRHAAGAVLLVLLPISMPPSADEIVVQGQRLRDVYVKSDGTHYVVHNPTSGALVRIPKSSIGVDDLSYSESPKEREKILKRWEAKRDESDAQSIRNLTFEEWKAQQGTEEETMQATPLPQARNGIRAKANKNGAITFTNVDRNDSSRLSGRNLFIDKNGVPILTNLPEEFRGNLEYAEIVLHFEQIDVPDKFRQQATAQAPLLNSSSIEEIVHHYARQHRIDPFLVFAVIKAESNGNPNAVSHAGARGLMQLMPGTARELGVRDIFDPAENVAGGTQYLSKLLTLYKGDVNMALAGYNAGPGNVRKYGGVPPFDETREYIKRVNRFHNNFQRTQAPQFQIARAPKPQADFIPEQRDKTLTIVLDNGLTIPAEKIDIRDGLVIYTNAERSGHVRQDQVRSIQRPY